MTKVMLVRLASGNLYEGETAAEVVRQMRLRSPFTAAQSDDEFMRGYAARVKEQMGTELDTTNAESFLTDLIKRGLAQKEN